MSAIGPARRRGTARRVKLAQRATGPTRDFAIRAGFLGGRYKALSATELTQVHAAVLDVLANIGMADLIPEIQQLALEQGCTLNEHGRLCFPKSLVEDIIAGAARAFPLYARDPKHDLEISSQRVHYGTGGAAVQVLDSSTNHYRPASLVDLYDFARLADQLDNIHWFTRCVIATDIEDTLELDLNTAYACLAATQKHLGTAITVADNVLPVIALFDSVLGGSGKFKQRPICKLHTSPIVSPLRYGEDACYTILAAIQAGMPINAITAAQAGATAPATLAGALVQSVAETLAALIMVNLISPGHPFIFSNWPMVSDLRTGAFSGGGGEGAVLNAAAAQVADFYDLPSGVAAGMSDSKLPDEQAGYEKALTNVLAGLSGANLVYESVGMMASLLGCSLESFVIDDEMLDSVIRSVRGIEVNEQTLSVDVIAKTVTGPGHFLGAAQTLATMETEYVYPTLGDRSTPSEWENNGAHDIRARAQAKVAKLMANYYPNYIADSQDKKIRARFPIRLPRDKMAPSLRWPNPET